MSRFQCFAPLALVGVLLAAAPVTALSQPAPKAANECFLSSDVNGFSAPDDHTLYLRVGVKDIYRLDLMGHCTDLTFRQSLGLKSTPESPWICSPLDATVVYGETGIPVRCPVNAIHKLTPDEVTALPKHDVP